MPYNINLDGGNSTTANGNQKCQRCKKQLPLSLFPLAKSGRRQGEITKTCAPCGVIKDAWRAKKNGPEKENIPGLIVSRTPDNKENDDSDFIGVTEISLDMFSSVLAKQNGCMQISARVNLSSLVIGEGGMKEKADKVAERVWDLTQYRFTYVTNLSNDLISPNCLFEI